MLVKIIPIAIIDAESNQRIDYLLLARNRTNGNLLDRGFPVLTPQVVGIGNATRLDFILASGVPGQSAIDHHLLPSFFLFALNVSIDNPFAVRVPADNFGAKIGSMQYILRKVSTISPECDLFVKTHFDAASGS